ncbi:amino acid adenylation protein [Streptomyces pluripotens]|uniref:Amino acid adenylation protein n=1 Tax=Streptomyces pluripotens TaxID=1355015 RepID=A0A221P5I1_9ACTN|nr:amino acid adenylation domain-containing protein [Streptomyces pluripotens]ARP73027.1 amino acid adenylation protein [Streptomyces pluripotens]ASN27278.1 amino acid adenylation protein [Streptomyces pluripotens]
MDDPGGGSTGGAGVVERLASQAAAHPNGLAVVHEAESLTYRELREAAADLARYLRHLGVAGDTVVGVCAEPSLCLMVGIWGVLHAGGAYLPLSPDYPDERLRYMAENSGVRVVFAQEELRERLAGVVPPDTLIVTIDEANHYLKKLDNRGGVNEAEKQLASVDTDPLPSPQPGDLAYVIYTSGSTGRPKGVMIEHRSITHQMHWFATTYGLGAGAVVLHKTPMSFDAAQWEILAPAYGARVVVGNPGIHRNPTQIVEMLVRHQVTALQCVPTLLQALVDTEELHRCTSLQYLFSGGEALSRSVARGFLRVLPECTLVNLYGPTECTINASACTVGPDLPAEGPHSLSIGSPVPGLRFHILDADRRPVAPGEVGELYISGIQLARGYLRRPDLTAERFLDGPADSTSPHHRLYRTGDLAHQNPDGTVQFTGRADNQVKLRGFRVELDEIRLAIEAHDWVRGAAVLVRDDPRTGFQNLVACIELSPREAALMDQGHAGDHHLSKQSRLQVKAQLAAPGTRTDVAGRPTVPLPGAEATPEQRRRAFARKTYRFYEGGGATAGEVLSALARRVPATAPRRPDSLTRDELGTILRDFGPHHSEERLLPKYAYASPGSLYATQLYVEAAGGAAGLEPGTYYFHPQQHQLVRVGDTTFVPDESGVRLHFLGRRSAIEPVYKNNIQEVLEMETGHMLGLFDEILPGHGLTLRELDHHPDTLDRLDCADDDIYLGSFALAPYAPADGPDPVDVYLQVHPGGEMGLPSGQYLHREGRWERISDDLVLKRHVIAINQQVYERACFGITVVSRSGPGWRRYIDLGRTLQRLQHNDSGLGFMSSGYSSHSGHDLPAARRIAAVLDAGGRPTGPCYFSVGGKTSAEQRAHQGMQEDAVHMRGPAEMIKDDLVSFLPDYMVPGRVIVLDRLPHTANGKVDVQALAARVDAALISEDRPVVPPRTRTEARLCDLWKAAMKREEVSVRDDFFACGGNSLIAVTLVHRINSEFGTALPLQVFFEAPTVEQLAERVDASSGSSAPRLLRLHTGSAGHAVFCWPGLGGYTMNLRLLAARASGGRPFYGIQAYGLNEGEVPHGSLTDMAAADVRALRAVQPDGPYTLWGYSFGARVAFEAARQLERAGEEVERLILIAPGSPRLRLPVPDTTPTGRRTARAATEAGGDRASGSAGDRRDLFTDPAFRTILYSVFAAATKGPLLEECLRTGPDEESFAEFVTRRLRWPDPNVVRRIIRLVRRTYGWLPEGDRISAPVGIITAAGDGESPLERLLARTGPPIAAIRLEADHYGALKDPGVDELAKAIRRVSQRDGGGTGGIAPRRPPSR